MKPSAATQPSDIPTGFFCFGNCRLEVPTHQLFLAGERVALRRIVFDLIVHLLRVRPRVATHQELTEQVWKRPDVSAGVIAKAVMEARRAIGDSGAEPAMIVSVHGLGYRFAGAVKEGADAERLPDDDELGLKVHAAADRADRALQAGDHALAQIEAERALMLAETGGISRARIEAMLVCSRVAHVTGPPERVGRLSNAALRLAKAEQQPDLVCAAQVEVARSHIMQGSTLMALEVMKPALRHLQDAGPSSLLLRCEMLMRRAHGDLQQFTDARAWCRRAQATAQQLGNPVALRKERNNEVSLLLTEGMWWAEQGQEERAREAYARALEVSEVVIAEAKTAPDSGETPETRLLWLGNHGFALMMNDRLELAWQYARAFGDTLDQWPSPDSPYIEGWRALFHGHMGLLLGRSRRFTEAFAQLEAGVELAAARNALPTLALLYRYSVDVSLGAGLHEKAFFWLRRQHLAERQLMSEQAARITALLRTETDTVSLRHELVESQARVQELEQRNRRLQARIRELDSSSSLDAQGFGKAALVHSELARDHADARALDIPYCWLLLSVKAPAPPATRLPSSAADHFFARLAQHLSTFEAIKHPSIRLGPTEVLLATHRMGTRRAAEFAAELIASLCGLDWSVVLDHGLRPDFECRWVDSASYTDVNAALAALRQD